MLEWAQNLSLLDQNAKAFHELRSDSFSAREDVYDAKQALEDLQDLSLKIDSQFVMEGQETIRRISDTLFVTVNYKSVLQVLQNVLIKAK